MPQKGETKTINGVTGTFDGTTWRKVGQGSGQGAPQSSAPEMYHPSLNDTPDSAYAKELARTAGEAGMGLLKSPFDLVKNTLTSIAHPIDAISNTASALAHPVDTFNALGAHPREAGSLIGQLLLAPRVPGMAEASVEPVGRGLGAVGRGMEAAGTAVLDNKGPLGMLSGTSALFGHPVAAAAEVGVPLAAKYGGRGLQKLGGLLKKAPIEESALEIPLPQNGDLGEIPYKAPPATPGDVVGPARTSLHADDIDLVRGMLDKGFNPQNAARIAGLPEDLIPAKTPPSTPPNLTQTSPLDPAAPKGDLWQELSRLNPSRTSTQGMEFNSRMEGPSIPEEVQMSTTPDEATRGLQGADPDSPFGPNTLGAAQRKGTNLPRAVSGGGFDPREFPPDTDSKTPPDEFIQKSNDFANSQGDNSEVARIQALIKGLLNANKG